MLYTENIVFIHVPKTAGMSITHFLVNALDDQVTVFAPENARSHTFNLAYSQRAAKKLKAAIGTRHENCWQAATLLRQARLPVPCRAFAVARDPAEQLWSYYRHLQKPWIWQRQGMDRFTLRGPYQLAATSGFTEFVEKLENFGMHDDQIAEYYRPGSFEVLDVVAFEDIEEYLVHRFSHHYAFNIAQLEHRNASSMVKVKEEITHEVASKVRSKYPLACAIYSESKKRAWRT